MLILSNSFCALFLCCVFGSVSLGRACSCLPWMSLFRLAFASAPSRVVFFSWCCGALLFRCCCSVLFLVWLPSRFLPWWLGCLRFGPLSPGFPLPSPPRLVVCLAFSGPVSVLLVPPSGYLVVSATVRLSYLWHGVSWLIGSCLHSASWQQRLRPCVGLCPLHHVVGVVHVPLAPALRYSPSGDPESP